MLVIYLKDTLNYINYQLDIHMQPSKPKCILIWLSLLNLEFIKSLPNKKPPLYYTREALAFKMIYYYGLNVNDK